MKRAPLAAIMLGIWSCAGQDGAREALRPEIPRVEPVLATEPVGSDADDPAVWIDPADPARSLIIATDKEAAPAGGVVVYDLEGRIVQRIGPLDRPNNVDVRQEVPFDGATIDLAVVTERYCHCLRAYRIDPAARRLEEISPPDGMPVFAGESGEAAEPMGLALYRRPGDGAVFAIVSRAAGPAEGYLWQYRLESDGAGRIRGVKVREFGAFSGREEIEAVAVDDELGYVYYSDERAGVHKYHADPDHPEADRELARFLTEGFTGDHEGLAIHRRPDGTGFIVATDQIDGDSEYYLLRREGEPDDPHDHTRVVARFRGGADATDGIEVVSTPLGVRFPAGLLVAMNSGGRNFLIYDWNAIAALLP